MPFQPVPQTFQVTMEYQYGTERIFNILAGRTPEVMDQSYLEGIGTAVEAWHGNNAIEVQSNELVLRTIRVFDISQAGGAFYERSCQNNCNGLVTGGGMPGNVTVATTFITAQRGRSFRGRAYWCGLAESSVVGNTIPQVAADAINDAWIQFGVTLAGSNAQHCVVSRYSGGVLREEGISTPITGYRTDLFVDSQRRRLAGRGT